MVSAVDVMTELDLRLEEIFDKADDFMINKKSYKDAVSGGHINISDETLRRDLGA